MVTTTVKDAFAAAPKVAITESALGTITFLPHARTGIAAALTTPFSRTASNRPSIEVRTAITDGAGATPVVQPMRLRGPGDVLGFDRRQVIRVYPQPGCHDTEPNYLAHVEFDRPDLPWMFTPTGPDGQGRLYPWIVLVVVRVGVAEVMPTGADRPPVLEVPRGELGDLDESWAWAHAQVIGPKSEAGGQSIAARVSDANPAQNLSRLICPRRLEKQAEYLACVVPAFACGVEAGMSRPVTTGDLAPAWTPGPADTPIQLPIFHQWRFATGEDADFEELATRLRARKAPPNLGVRKLDVTHAGSDIRVLEPDAPGARELVEGPVVSPFRTPSPATWPATEARDELVEALDRVDDAMKVVTPETDPAIGPPLYGGTHLGLARVDGPQPPWYETLNLDPRHRVVGGLGTRIVQMDQEELMNSAWTQVAGVELANRTLRLAQMSRYVAERLHARHLSRLPVASLLSVTHLAHSRLLSAPGSTVRAAVELSATPSAVSSPAMRRMFRERGPVGRFTDGAQRDAMVSAVDGTSRNWVRQHVAPDGVGHLGALAIELAGPDAARLADELEGSRAWPDVLAAGELEEPTFERETFVASMADAIVDRLLWATPMMISMRNERDVALVGASRVPTLRAAVMVLSDEVDEVHVAHDHELRLEVFGTLSGDDYRVGLAEIDRLADVIVELAQGQWDIRVDEQGIDEAAGELRRYLGLMLEHGEEGLRRGLVQLAEPIVAPGGPTDIDRTPLAVFGLDLLTNLHPAVTVTKRLRGRLGTLPGWVRPGWFDDLRLEAVMAAPRFPFPMWPALDRYDREWMVPGLGTLETPDVVTVLETNSAFVEAFLVGLNHEMGRELLWRGYPTDQRGTCFRSFWTGRDELVDDVHRWGDGALGDHIDPRLSGKLVLLVRGELVRRYPDLIAHAQQASAEVDGLPVLDGPFRETLFRAHLSPNVLLVGFDLTEEEAKPVGNRWWFTLAEHPAGPRFGFDDEDQPAGPTIDDLRWTELQTNPGSFLRATIPVLTFGDRVWGATAASNAAISLQLPARAAFRASEMLTAVDADG